MDLRDGLDRRGKSRLHRDFFFDIKMQTVKIKFTSLLLCTNYYHLQRVTDICEQLRNIQTSEKGILILQSSNLP